MKKIMNVIILLCILAIVLYFAKRDDEKVIVEEIQKIIINVNDRDLIVELEKNSSAKAFYERLKKESVTVSATNRYNFTKLGRVTNYDAYELRDLLGKGDTIMKFSIKR